MAKSFLETVIGSLDEKKEWREQMKRVEALPEEYCFTYKKIMNYGYNYGFCCLSQSSLLELFEEGAAAGRSVSEIVGSDAAAFCDELIRVNTAETAGAGEKLNREIAEYFQRKGR